MTKIGGDNFAPLPGAQQNWRSDLVHWDICAVAEMAPVKVVLRSA